MQRLEDLLQGHEQSSEDVIPVLLSSSTTLRLSRQVIMTRSDNCHILVFRSVLLCFVFHCLVTIVTCIVFRSVLLCFVCVCHCLVTIVTCIVFRSVLLSFVCVCVIALSPS